MAITRKALFAAAALVGLAGCLTPPSQAQLLADSAYEMNTASRFGRIDVALDHVGAHSQDDFSRRHAGWGREMRIVDVELTSLRMIAKDEASVLVSVAWQRPADAIVRFTHLAQCWRDERGGGWLLVSEEPVGGDSGLLGEPTKNSAGAAPDEVDAAPAEPSPRVTDPSRIGQIGP